MKSIEKQSSIKSYIIGTLLRFLGFGFIIYDSLFRIYFNPKYKGDFGCFALIIKVYNFFEINRAIFLLGCCFFPLVLLGSIFWLRVCKKSMLQKKGTSIVYYLSVFVFALALIVFVSSMFSNDYDTEVLLRIIFMSTIAVFLIADVWNTIDIVVKHRKKLL